MKNLILLLMMILLGNELFPGNTIVSNDHTNVINCTTEYIGYGGYEVTCPTNQQRK